MIAAWLMSRNLDLPRYAILGVTASEILMFRAEAFHAGWNPVELVERFPRSSTRVSVQQGVPVRKLTLEPQGGRRVALESPRLGAWHSAGMLAVLADNAATPGPAS